tara:strand:+ start:271 stop:696 length:426 start_codon:yes stop_codon:yes gene_type:complete
MMSEREQIQQEIFEEINNEDNKLITELTPQEEVDMHDTPGLKYNYKDPNHKPPFKNGEDYTEYTASENEEINSVAFGKHGYYLKQITEKNEIAYLYHNRNTNKIEIWGESRKFDSVISEIKNRYENAENYLNNKKKKEDNK